MNSAASDVALIGVDWGTTSLRAYLIGQGGQVLERLSDKKGIRQTGSSSFDDVFTETLGPWLKRYSVPVVVSGMVTSRNGWRETPYLELPTDTHHFADGLVELRLDSGCSIHFVNGVSSDADALPDVMRGEETQIVGAVADGGGDGVYVLPGTHSKWVFVRDGKIDHFDTFMTGEVRATLIDHTILGALRAPGPSRPSHPGFVRGLTSARNKRTSGLLSLLFSARTLPLFGRIEPEDVDDYLSGLLIGDEVLSASARYNCEAPIALIGEDALCELYAEALSEFGISSRRFRSDIAARGHFEIAKKRGLVQ